MVKDHDLHLYITKEEIQSLVRSINNQASNNNKKADNNNLE